MFMAAQYKGLGELHDKYKPQGFEVLAFPCASAMAIDDACADSGAPVWLGPNPSNCTMLPAD